jgi:hypothetical protein
MSNAYTSKMHDLPIEEQERKAGVVNLALDRYNDNSVQSSTATDLTSNVAKQPNVRQADSRYETAKQPEQNLNALPVEKPDSDVPAKFRKGEKGIDPLLYPNHEDAGKSSRTRTPLRPPSDGEESTQPPNFGPVLDKTRAAVTTPQRGDEDPMPGAVRVRGFAHA